VVVVGKPRLEWLNKINGSIQAQMGIVRSTMVTAVIEMVTMEVAAVEAMEVAAGVAMSFVIKEEE